MRPVRLRIDGFKSFADAVEVPLEPGLVGLVGPNGAGKSNVTEALRWVLGGRGRQDLRANRGASLLFAGTSGPRSRSARDWAEVTLEFAEGASGTEALHVDGTTEVVRRVEMKPDGGSETAYRIGGSDVRAADAMIWLGERGVDGSPTSFIAQGRVDEVVSARPADRRRLLEEAVGLSGIERRRARAERELDTADRIVARQDDLMSELDDRAAALRTQARVAERHAVLTVQIKDAARDLAQAKLSEAEAAAVAARTTHEGVVVALGEAREAASDAEAFLTRTRASSTEIEAELARTTTSDAARQRAAADHVAACARLEAQLEGLDERAEELRRERAEAEAELRAARKAPARTSAPSDEPGAPTGRTAETLLIGTHEGEPIGLHVHPDYRTAVSALLRAWFDRGRGDASIWTGAYTQHAGPSWPEGIRPLQHVAEAPAALDEAVRCVGVVDGFEDGERLAPGLARGLTLVSRDGDMWRWDGMVVMGEDGRGPSRPPPHREDLSLSRAPSSAPIADQGPDASDRTAARLERLDVAIEGLAVRRQRAEEKLAAARAAAAEGTQADEAVRALRQDLEAGRQHAARDVVSASEAMREIDRRVARLEAEEAQARAALQATEAARDELRGGLGGSCDAKERDEDPPPFGRSAPGASHPDRDGVERRLARLTRERDRLGAVNANAPTELATLERRIADARSYRDDVAEASGRLRELSATLREEGRELVADGFRAVNANFAQLMARLFPGAEAWLEMERDDPLEAELDVGLRLRGKREASLSLLSGGERTLTAIALLFAVLLARPSPLIVLDEVDAALDAANADRLARLLREVQAATDACMLVVTHNSRTISAMDRLCLVEMPEPGVSSVRFTEMPQSEARTI